MRRTFLFMFFCVAINLGGISQTSKNESVIVPFVKNCPAILTDGIIEDEEWSDAKKISLNGTDSCFVYIKQNEKFIFIAIKAPFKMLPYVDLFFDYGSGFLHNLHSSSQIGERFLKDTAWNDNEPAFHFGNSNGWYANEQRFDRIKATELLKSNPNRDRNTMQWETNFYYEGYEYILKKSRFNQKKWKCRIEVKTGMPGYENIYYPAASIRKQSSTWAELTF